MKVPVPRRRSVSLSHFLAPFSFLSLPFLITPWILYCQSTEKNRYQWTPERIKVFLELAQVFWQKKICPNCWGTSSYFHWCLAHLAHQNVAWHGSHTLWLTVHESSLQRDEEACLLLSSREIMCSNKCCQKLTSRLEVTRYVFCHDPLLPLWLTIPWALSQWNHCMYRFPCNCV